MFVGHYAAAFVLKGKSPKASLGVLFIATQFVDILFFPFTLLGWEKLEFVSGFTAVNDFKMTFPFTHGLLASILWAGIFGGVYLLLSKREQRSKKKIAIIMTLGVLSHWFADLIVHTPDLPLLHGEPKLGFGLWNNKLATFIVELVLLVVAAFYFLKQTVLMAKKRAALYVWSFVLFMILVNYLNYYVLPVNHDLVSLTISALISYFLFAGIAHWVEIKSIKKG
ncbi:permease [Croceivirga lutea]|uniref:hypothetical protein n=1 Tax=Croceivirga lutea TaxID=1775167 RepID=UPI00163B3A68|nr:hypothetical protein [Croceivirga lutea]GGG53544.1 permease [Croceivirga lutea]